MQISFEEYRDKILSIIETAKSHITYSPPQDTTTLDLGRISMARTLTAYHLYAERELFGPCVGALDPAYRARVREISAECAALANGFRSFSRECANDPVIGRWTSYRVTALAMMERIRNHLQVAEVEVIRCEQAKNYIQGSRAA